MCIHALKRSLPEILPRVASAPHTLLLLDFDSTLAAHQPHPDLVRVPTPALRWLCDLLCNPRLSAGLVSGRPIRDLGEHVPFQGMIFAGNHGNEIRGRGLHFIEPLAFLVEPDMEQIASQLQTMFAGQDLIWVENKRLTATVHMRGAEPLPAQHASDLVSALVRESPRLRCRGGRDSIDILPNNDWHKGAAIRWIQKELDLDDALLLYAGDDASDEDVFREFPDALTIHVGHGYTQARFRAESPVEIWALLGTLASTLAAAPLLP